jgi:two-component system, sensor histidine kinase PdtaS
MNIFLAKLYLLTILLLTCTKLAFAQDNLPKDLQLSIDTAKQFSTKFFSYIDAGDYYYQLYNAAGYSKAATYYEKARTLARDEKDSISIGIAYHSLAEVYDALGDDKLPTALAYYKIFNRTSILSNDTGTIIRSYIDMALTEMHLNQLANCKNTIETTINLAKKYKKPKVLNRCYVVAAFALTKLNQFENGRTYFDKIDVAKDTIRNGTLSYGNMYYLTNLILLGVEKKYKEGLSAGQVALKYCTNASDSLMIMRNTAEMAFADGQYKIAYEFKNKENELYGNITRGNSLNDANNSLLQSELKLKDENRQLLLNKTSIQKKINVGLTIGIALMAFAIGGILWLSYTRRKKNIELAHQVNENKLLLQEVHHRVKNNLQIVNSFLLMEDHKENGGGKIFIKELQSKIQAISLLHQKLHQEDDFKSVLLQPYFEQLFEKIITAHVLNEEQINWQVSTNDLTMRQDKLVSLALIITELLLNTIKYVSVHQFCNISFTMHAEENFVSAQYLDNGPGLPKDFNWEKINSTGLMLVKQLSKQLGATISIIKNENTSGFALKILTVK